MEKDKDVCYFYSPTSEMSCSVLNTCCTGTRSKRLCHFYKTEREFIESRNKAVELNRKKGRCAICKYKSQKCDLIKLGDDKYDS